MAKPTSRRGFLKTATASGTAAPFLLAARSMHANPLNLP
ncbi:MAG: twin-arginine translocation signal domain-containing protein, partial [Bryobacteraceae bacterium]